MAQVIAESKSRSGSKKFSAEMNIAKDTADPGIEYLDSIDNLDRFCKLIFSTRSLKEASTSPH